MRSFAALSILVPLARAISQLDDPAFRSALLGSLAWSVASFVALYVGAVAVIHHVLESHGWLAWGADVVGSIAVSLLTLWLFLPVAAAVGVAYLERIANAVERKFYPWLPPPNGASFLEQALDGISVGLRVLGLNIVALVLASLVPGIGFILGWMTAAYAIGRGLFVATSMRRMSRRSAESLYRANKSAVLAQGGVMALAAYVPVMNLLIPIIGVAAMVHVLDMALMAGKSTSQRLV